MDKSPMLNIVLSFALLLIGLMFLEGIWRGKGTVIKGIVNIDNFLFPKIKDKRILKSGDQLAFLVCSIMSLLTIINGFLFLISDNIPNISAIFISIAIVFSWPMRIIFIFLNRNRAYKNVSRIWPFSK